MKAKLILVWLICPALLSFGQSNPIWKQFGNRVIDITQPRTLYTISGKVNAILNGVLILDVYVSHRYGGSAGSYNESIGAYSGGGLQGGTFVQEYDHSIALTNFEGILMATVNKEIVTKGLKIGIFQTDQGPVELWDCGRAYVPPPLTPEQLAAAQDAAKERAIADKKNAARGQIKAVEWLQTQATNGSISAQCSLGEHYLTGTGCETNRDLGIYWLNQAASAGDLESSNKLATLK